MKIEIENVSKTARKLKFQIDEKEVAHAYDHAYKAIGKKANLKGFRPGKVPAHVLDQYYASDIAMESLNHLINDTYIKALQEHNLRPVLDPKFNLKPLEKGKAFNFDAEIEIIPEFEISNYKKIPIKKRKAELKDEEVETSLKNIAETHAELHPVETALGKGLVGVLDFDGTLDAKPFPGGRARDFQFEFGSGHLLPAFEANVEGLKKGDKKDFDFTFPGDYHDATLQGKSVRFSVAVNGVFEKKLPKLDDEFAKDLGKESLEALKKEIGEQIIKRKENEFRKEYAKEVMDHLIDKNKVDIPEGLIAKEAEHAKDNDKTAAGRRLLIQLLLGTISGKESIKVEPKEVDAHLQSLAMMYRQPVASVQKFYREGNRMRQLIDQIALEKTLDFLINEAELS